MKFTINAVQLTNTFQKGVVSHFGNPVIYKINVKVADARFLYARYLVARATHSAYAAGRPSAARDDRVSCIQARFARE